MSRLLTSSLISLLLICYIQSLGQNQGVIDSLLLIEQEKKWNSNIEEIHLYDELSFQYRSISIQDSRYYATKVIKLSEQLKYPIGIALGEMTLGVLSTKVGKDITAINHFKTALNLRAKHGSSKSIASACNSLGLAFKNLGKFDESIIYFQRGIDEISPQPSSLLCKLYNNLGSTNSELGNYEQAFINFDKSHEISSILGSDLRSAAAFLNTANLYFKIGNLIEAKKNYREALSLYNKKNYDVGIMKCYLGFGNVAYEKNKFEEAILNYDEVININAKGSSFNIIKAYLNKGIALSYLNKFEEAIENLHIYLKYQNEVENNYKIALAYLNIGKVYARKKDYQEAVKWYKKSQEAAPSDIELTFQSDLYKDISHIYISTNEYKKASEILSKLEGVTDSLRNNQVEAANYKTSYEREKADKERIESQLALKDSKQEKQQLFTTSLIIGILMLLGLVGITFAGYYQRQKRLEAEREIDHLLTDIELETTYARLEGQDTERKRIAQDLHDGLGSMLSTVKLYFGSIEEKLDLLRSENKGQYEKATLLLDQACDEVRRVAHQMKSGTLEKFGLPAELESLAKIIRESKQIKVELLTHQMEERIDNKVESNLYRITQEIISNILKHAKATKISIELNRFDDIISLVIEDNGVGFDLEEAKAKGGIGIEGIATRVEKIDGTLNIDTQIGRGTSISIDIPYEREG